MLPGTTSKRRTSMPLALSRFSKGGVDSAGANTARPPARCQPCAIARHRITWPEPMRTPPSARMRSRSETVAMEGLEHSLGHFPVFRRVDILYQMARQDHRIGTRGEHARAI